MVGVKGGLLCGQGLLHLVAGVDQEDGGVCGLQKISLLLNTHECLGGKIS